MALLALACLIAPVDGARAQAQHVMKIAAVTVRDPVHMVMDEFKRRIEQRSGGRIEARVYPASQLGDISRLLEGLQLGTIESVVSAAGFYQVMHPAFQVGDVPGLFRDMHHAHKAMTDPAFRERFLALAEPKGVLGVTIWVYGPTHYASVTPIRSLDEFKGKKIRIFATRIEREVASKLGGTAIPVPLSEALQALQNRVVDVSRSTILVFAGLKYHTIAKYVIALDDAVIPGVVAVSTQFYAKLPGDLAKAVLDVGREMDEWAYKTSAAADQGAEKLWRENGGEVIRMPPADQAELRRRLAPIGDEVLGTNQDTREIWQLLKQTATKYK
jgi:TRAP-type C4-dicarboxylate transport system substrate-binding protein